METREVEKIYVEDHGKKYASKSMAGTALGFGIAGTALWLLNGGLGRFGGFGCGSGEAVVGAMSLEQKECADVLALTSALYQGELKQQSQRFNDRQTINQEMFGIYNKNITDNFNLYKSQIDADFNLYKNQRDQFDVLKAEIDNLKCKVAVDEAVRPYQDALINCKIDKTADVAEWNLDRRTCRMITGELVLPNSPTVTGYPSYNGCCTRVISSSPVTTAKAA